MSASRPLKGFECLAPASGPAMSTPALPGRRGKGGRFTVMLNPFIDRRLRDLTLTEAVVWMILFRDAKHNRVRVAHSDLARRGGIAGRSVVNALSGLRRKGLVRTVTQGRMNVGISVHELLPP